MNYYNCVRYQNRSSDSRKYVPKNDTYRMKPLAIDYQICYADTPELFLFTYTLIGEKYDIPVEYGTINSTPLFRIQFYTSIITINRILYV